MKNITKIFLCLIILTMAGCAKSDNRGKWIPLISDMVISVPYNPYGENPNTKDGKTLMTPPAGTVPQGFEPDLYEKNMDGAQKAALELKNPIPLTPENLARGKQVYESKCLVCHGAEGKADGPIIGKFPNPTSYASDRVRNLAAGNIYHSITVGVGLMGSYGAQISPEDRWKLVHYVNHLVAELKK